MRIIAGEARGRKLVAPAGDNTRPTGDKVRESVFNILSARLVLDARVLDLFGGSGAMALEALSRGAEFAWVSDVDKAALAVIDKNAEAVLKTEKEARLKVVRGDYRDVIERTKGEAFTLVFLDPPYRMREVYGEALKRMRRVGVLAAGAVIVLEHDEAFVPQVPEGFAIYDSRRYRDTVVTFVRYESGIQ